MRLVAQRLDFIHPGESFVLVVVFFLLYSLESFSASQLHADFNSLQLFIKLSFGNSALELLGKKGLCEIIFTTLCKKCRNKMG